MWSWKRGIHCAININAFPVCVFTPPANLSFLYQKVGIEFKACSDFNACSAHNQAQKQDMLCAGFDSEQLKYNVTQSWWSRTEPMVAAFIEYQGSALTAELQPLVCVICNFVMLPSLQNPSPDSLCSVSCILWLRRLFTHWLVTFHALFALVQKCSHRVWSVHLAYMYF